jgi:hypothetical protein
MGRGRGQGREAFRRFTAATAAQRTPQLTTTTTTVPHQPEVEKGKERKNSFFAIQISQKNYSIK